MTDVERQIRARVEAFVGELSGLVRQAALEAVQDALEGAPTAAPRRAAGKRPAAVTRSKRGGRRSPNELNAMADQLMAAVTAQPGLRIEELGKAMEIPTRELALPVTKLIKAGKLRREGRKRATKYFPASARSRGGGKKRVKAAADA